MRWLPLYFNRFTPRFLRNLVKQLETSFVNVFKNTQLSKHNLKTVNSRNCSLLSSSIKQRVITFCLTSYATTKTIRNLAPILASFCLTLSPLFFLQIRMGNTGSLICNANMSLLLRVCAVVLITQHNNNTFFFISVQAIAQCTFENFQFNLSSTSCLCLWGSQTDYSLEIHNLNSSKTTSRIRTNQ